MRLRITPEQLEADSSKEGYDLKIRNGVIGWYLDSAVWEPPWRFYGCTEGYTVGGRTVPGGCPSGFTTSVIDKFSFASDANATSIGSSPLTGVRHAVGNRSETHGYTDGSYGVSCLVSNRAKLEFSSGTVAATSGNLIANVAQGAGITSDNCDRAYLAGGGAPPQIQCCFFRLQAYPFANDTVSCISNIGFAWGQRGHSSGENGFLTQTNTIKKFPFSNETDVSTIGCTSPFTGRGGSVSQSRTHGYLAGAGLFYGNNLIHKYPFVGADVCSTLVGCLLPAPSRRGQGSGTTSQICGYSAGGICLPNNGGGYTHGSIEKFSFSSDGNATTVGSLSTARGRNATSGYQV